MRFVLSLLALVFSTASAFAEDWQNPIRYLGKLDSPLVEVTPFVFQDRYYLLENWQKQWEFPGTIDGGMFQQDEIRIRDMATDEIISMPLIGHGLGMAFVHDGRVYVFGGDWGDEKKWQITEITMVSSSDLVHWTEPVVVLKADAHEKFFNVSVCRGLEQFVMLVESNDPAWPAFTFKYFTSDNLSDWTKVPDAEYGREKYVGGPALYYEGDHYYTLYLHALGDNHYETRVARSKDLLHWQDAPDDRPVATFNKENKVHPLRPDHIREQNASDLEFCYWDGKTRIYYTGGDQRLAGDLQHAEYDGTPRELLEHFFADAEAPTPAANQQRYQEKQLGAFVHFGPASFIGGDDYLTAPEASVFDPKELDAAQWMRAAKAFGARHIVLTAKHHNGFCLWPTETTDYSVASAPWKDGGGDVVREFVDAAREQGIAPGLYLSAGDTHFGCTATPEPRGVRKVKGDAEAYFPIFMEQLTELLTNYGPLEVVWFDGAYNPFDPDVLGPDGAPLGNRYAEPITEAVRRLQPEAVIMGGAHPDIRWSGSEQGKAPYPLWNIVAPGTGREHWLPDDATGWFIPEANIHTRRHWFWSPDSDATLKTVPEMLAAYETSIGHGANLLVNLTPDTRGRVPEAEVVMLEGFGKALDDAYTQPVADAPSPIRWEEGHTVRLRFDAPKAVGKVVIEEDLSRGQRIRAYRIEALQDGKWQAVASGESIGRRRIQSFDPVTTASLRIKVTESVPMPHLRGFAVYAPYTSLNARSDSAEWMDNTPVTYVHKLPKDELDAILSRWNEIQPRKDLFEHYAFLREIACSVPENDVGMMGMTIRSGDGELHEIVSSLYREKIQRRNKGEESDFDHVARSEHDETRLDYSDLLESLALNSLDPALFDLVMANVGGGEQRLRYLAIVGPNESLDQLLGSTLQENADGLEMFRYGKDGLVVTGVRDAFKLLQLLTEQHPQVVLGRRSEVIDFINSFARYYEEPIMVSYRPEPIVRDGLDLKTRRIALEILSQIAGPQDIDTVLSIIAEPVPAAPTSSGTIRSLGEEILLRLDSRETERIFAS